MSLALSSMLLRRPPPPPTPAMAFSMPSSRSSRWSTPSSTAPATPSWTSSSCLLSSAMLMKGNLPDSRTAETRRSKETEIIYGACAKYFNMMLPLGAVISSLSQDLFLLLVRLQKRTTPEHTSKVAHLASGAEAAGKKCFVKSWSLRNESRAIGQLRWEGSGRRAFNPREMGAAGEASSWSFFRSTRKICSNIFLRPDFY